MQTFKLFRRYSVIILAVSVLLIFAIFLVGTLLTRMQYSNRPVNQPNTKWYSEDGKITFETDENGRGIGTIVTKDDDVVDIFFCTGRGQSIDIYLKNGETNGDIIEMWIGKFIKKDMFIAYIKESTYYENGDKIVFHRQ